MGSTVYIDNKKYIAQDTGGAIKGKHIDVYVDSHEEALNLGIDYCQVKIKVKE